MPVNTAHDRPMAANGYSRPNYSDSRFASGAVYWPGGAIDGGGGISGGTPARTVKWPMSSHRLDAAGDERRLLNRVMVKSGAFAEDYRVGGRKNG